MILTVTPAPALDRTYTASAFREGQVNRAESSVVEASGKGVNVTRALAATRAETVAVLPLGGAEGRQLAELLAVEGVSFLAVSTDVPTRTNTTLAVAGRGTTKMNAPSSALPEHVWADLRAGVADLLGRHPGAWLLCSGSVPVGAEHLPAELVELARRLGARSAVDSSGAALRAAIAAGPDLIAPNHLELAELVGVDPGTLDPDGAAGDEGSALVRTAAGWARIVATRTNGAVLATLGAGGAVYADATGTWHASAPPITVVNTVGAGDALLAGFLSVAGASTASPALPASTASPAAPGGALATAVAWGTSACALPGTSGKVAQGADVSRVTIRQLS